MSPWLWFADDRSAFAQGREGNREVRTSRQTGDEPIPFLRGREPPRVLGSRDGLLILYLGRLHEKLDLCVLSPHLRHPIDGSGNDEGQAAHRSGVCRGTIVACVRLADQTIDERGPGEAFGDPERVVAERGDSSLRIAGALEPAAMRSISVCR